MRSPSRQQPKIAITTDRALIRALENHPMTRAELARQTGISEATISRLGRERMPTPDQQILLWQVLGVRPDQWFANIPELKPEVVKLTPEQEARHANGDDVVLSLNPRKIILRGGGDR